MSDQNVITDYRAYFASLPPGRPFTAEQLTAMVNPLVEVILLLDETPGQLMTRLVLEAETCFEEALLEWTARGEPRAWLQLGAGTAPWFCDATARPTRGRVRSRS
jgi:hypothetical protein